MRHLKHILLFVCWLPFLACHRDKAEQPYVRMVDSLNAEAIDLRYKDIPGSKAKAFQALELIEKRIPDYYQGKAQAWNNIAFSNFRTSYFDSTRFYLEKVRAIESVYDNKEIEEAISHITEARLFLRECRYADAFVVYDSLITVFKGGFNKLKYNDMFPFKRYDHNRYNFAKSEYLLGNATLDYYYRDTELPVILQLLDQIENNPNLQIDTTQLSILYYSYGGSYDRAIRADVSNFDHALDYVIKGLDLLSDTASRNDYYVANFYQLASSLVRPRRSYRNLSLKESRHITDRLQEFREQTLGRQYHWKAHELDPAVLPLVLLQKADSLFRQYDDPYQNLASGVHIANQYLIRGDTVTALTYFSRAMEADSLLDARHGHARIWKRQLYNSLLSQVADKFPISEVRRWYRIYANEAAIIAENTKLDYDAQQGKAEAEALARRSIMLLLLILSICVVVTTLLYFLNRQNNKLKKARSVLRQRNEELEENREDLESLAKIGKQVVSTLEIDDDSQKIEFVEGIYRHIKDLKTLAALPDLSLTLYIRNPDNQLQRFCKEDLDSAVDVSLHTLDELHRPAIGCFVKYQREVLSFDDWNAEYAGYAAKVGIDPGIIKPGVAISGNPTRSLAYLNLYSKKGDKIGVLSLQTTELGAFNQPLLQASFEIIAEYVAAALDNAMQYQELRFVQKKLIEQKRMELLTYVVRGISHELSQPLGSITQTLYDSFSDIETLSRDKAKLSAEEYDRMVANLHTDLKTIAQSKDTISDLVNSFRNTIKENILDPETDFNLSRKLEDVIKVIRPTVKPNVDIRVECDPELEIRSFPLLLSQVITNLISNANQHAFSGSDDPNDTIRIVCNRSGENLIIQCIDNGTGVPDDQLDRLCQPFVSRKNTNLGLGLSLVKNIVEQYMKGEITFASDNGLTVTVTIPNCIIT